MFILKSCCKRHLISNIFFLGTAEGVAREIRTWKVYKLATITKFHFIAYEEGKLADTLCKAERSQGPSSS